MPKTPSLILPDSLPGSWLARSKITKRNKPNYTLLHNNSNSSGAVGSHGLANAVDHDATSAFVDDEDNNRAPSTFSINSSILLGGDATKRVGDIDDDMADISDVNCRDSATADSDSQYEFQYQPFHQPYATQQAQLQQQQQQHSQNVDSVDVEPHTDIDFASTTAQNPSTESSNNQGGTQSRQISPKQTATTTNIEVNNISNSVQPGQKRQFTRTIIQGAIEEEEHILDLTEEDLMQLDGLKPEKNYTANTATSNNNSSNKHKNTSNTGNVGYGSQQNNENKQSISGNSSQIQCGSDHKRGESLINASQSLSVEFQAFMEEHRQIKRSIESKKNELEQYITDRMEYLQQRQQYFQSQLKLLQEFL